MPIAHQNSRILAALARPVAAEEPPQERDGGEAGEGATATATRPAPSPPRPRRLPPSRVLLHNDDVNDMLFVASAIVELARLTRPEALERIVYRCLVVPEYDLEDLEEDLVDFLRKG